MQIKPEWWSLAFGLLLSTPMVMAPAASAGLEPLGTRDIDLALTNLPGWHRDGESLTCTYRFNTFVEAIAFVNQLVEPAERIGHHPDLSISYNVVGISLTTHDAGGLTQLDTQLATAIAQLASAQGLSRCAE